MESGKKINITPYRSGQLLELAGDLAKRMTASEYGYLTYDEIETVIDTLKAHFADARSKGEI